MSRLRKSLTFSNTVALVALFFALGGTVYAASNKIDGSQITPKSLPGNRLKAQSVTAAQIKNGAIGTSQLKKSVIGEAQLKAAAVSANKIKTGTITGAQIKAGSISGTQIQSGSLGATQINQTTLTGISAANIHTVQYVTATVPLVEETEAGNTGTATCPTGMKVIGGGATTTNNKFGLIYESGPNGERNGWYADGGTFGPGVNMTITAICTAVAAPVG